VDIGEAWVEYRHVRFGIRNREEETLQIPKGEHYGIPP
jgi:hypothetical protein